MTDLLTLRFKYILIKVIFLSYSYKYIMADEAVSSSECDTNDARGNTDYFILTMSTFKGICALPDAVVFNSMEFLVMANSNKM